MSEPGKEHIEAVAEVGYRRRYCFEDCEQCGYDCWCDCLNCTARAILISTEPAVLDAMQDALVRAGRLRDEAEATWRLPSGRPSARWYDEAYVDDVIAQEANHPQPLTVEKVIRRRLITEWESA